jgi:DNA-binding transcriptional ArsR family regulator
MIMKKEKLYQTNGAKDFTNNFKEEFEIQFSEVAALLGNNPRSLMLWNLLDGRAYTATELSLCAEISAQSASNHLTKLVEANLLIVEKQGRHRYYRFANPDVARVVESMASLIPISQNYKKVKKPEPTGELFARTCYDHLAGKVGVDLTNSLINKGLIEVIGTKYNVTHLGEAWFQSIGINVDELKSQKRSFAHQCLDWSERKHHIAGALGATILEVMLINDWLRRKNDNSREVIITPKGRKELEKRFGLNF